MNSLDQDNLLKYATNPLRGLAGLLALCSLLASCSSDSTEVPAMSAAALHGKQIFNQCRACHAIDKRVGHLVGPNLHGVYGVGAGQRPGYAYSSAMRQSGIVWNDTALDAFLTRPGDYVPGTKMTFGGLAQATDRAGVIAYLKTSGAYANSQ